MAHISSRKIGRKHGGAAAIHLRDGQLAEPFGVVFSGGSLILNMTNGERMFALILEPHETTLLAQRFTERRGED